MIGERGQDMSRQRSLSSIIPAMCLRRLDCPHWQIDVIDSISAKVSHTTHHTPLLSIEEKEKKKKAERLFLPCCPICLYCTLPLCVSIQLYLIFIIYYLSSSIAGKPPRRSASVGRPRSTLIGGITEITA
jgi:hypothetical protein